MRSLAYKGLSIAARLWVERPGTLRVLAYHDVSDVGSFRAQMGIVKSHYTPVGLEEVVEFIQGRQVPTGACWVTFDDGHPSIVTHAMGVLADFGIQATAFVCPAFVDSSEPYWWQVVEAAVAFGKFPGKEGAAAMIRRLKQVPDLNRRRIVDELRLTYSTETGDDLRVRQLTMSELTRWLRGGHQIGNHTWDHPVLNMCSSSEQERQIRSASEWLRAMGGECDRFFAYPNGNWTGSAQGTLVNLGYEGALLFDHKLEKLDDPLRISRIRVNGKDHVNEFWSKISGLHPTIHHLRQKVR